MGQQQMMNSCGKGWSCGMRT